MARSFGVDTRWMMGTGTGPYAGGGFPFVDTLGKQDAWIGLGQRTAT